MATPKLRVFFARMQHKEAARLRKLLIEKLGISNSSYSRKLNENERHFTNAEKEQITEILNDELNKSLLEAELFD